MTFAKVQGQAGNNTINTVLTVTLGAGTTQHNLLVVTHSNDGGTSPAAVPTSISLVGTGQNLTMITSAAQTNGTASIQKSIWYLKDIPAGATQITATLAATSAQLMEVEEFSGADTASPLITNAFSGAVAPAGTQQTTYDSTAAPGTTPSGSLWVAGFTGVDSGTHPTITTAQGYTLETAQVPGSSTTTQLGYILSSANAGPQVSGSITAPVAGAWWAAVTAGFAAASGTTNVNVSDNAAMNESVSVTVTASVADNAAMNESPAVSATVPVSDNAAINETLAVSATVNVSDNAAANESLAAFVTLSVTDNAAINDAPSLLILISVTDNAAINESPAISVSAHVSDNAAMLDRIFNSGALSGLAFAKVTTIMVASRTGLVSAFTIEAAAGVPYQGNMRQLALDRWNYMYPST